MTPTTGLFGTIGQPLLIVGTFALWLALGGDEAAFGLAWLVLVLTLVALEQIVPHRPAERPTLSKRAVLIVTGFVLSALLGLLGGFYEEVLRPLFAPLTNAGPGALWPRGLHWSVQVLLLYLLSDGINYWLHRAIHRWPLLWRISGHGVHHAFHNLNAHHSILTHPLELFFLAAPMAIAAAFFGIETPVVLGASLLLTTVAMLAHANLDLDTPGLRWIVTQPVHHRLHHSLDPDERETNYACTAILWDRLFGTFDDRVAERTGMEPQPPTLGSHLMRPFRNLRRT
jgi:sterol desaturase/sphingolipid hydroxylase (fatty acid hydroxylase superfamily)